MYLYRVEIQFYCAYHEEFTLMSDNTRIFKSETEAVDDIKNFLVDELINCYGSTFSSKDFQQGECKDDFEYTWEECMNIFGWPKYENGKIIIPPILRAVFGAEIIRYEYLNE